MAAGTPASLWVRAFVLCIPVMAGYLAVGAAFGILWVQQGLEPLGAPLFGAVVYAGASQFMAAGMLAAGQGAVEIALATFVLNARHAVYGLAFLDRLPSWSAARVYFAFALTDETYAVLASASPLRDPQRDRGLLWRVALLNHLYWVVGCAAGVVLAGVVPPELAGLDFALAGLFLVLLIEQVRMPGRRASAVAAGAVAAVGAMLFGTGGALVPVLAAALVVVSLMGRSMERPGEHPGEHAEEHPGERRS